MAGWVLTSGKGLEVWHLWAACCIAVPPSEGAWLGALTCRTLSVHVHVCILFVQRIQQRAEKKLFLDQMVNRGSVAGGQSRRADLWADAWQSHGQAHHVQAAMHSAVLPAAAHHAFIPSHVPVPRLTLSLLLKPLTPLAPCPPSCAAPQAWRGWSR